MTNNTTTLQRLGVEVPEEGYDVGYGTAAKSYAELIVEAFQATDAEFGNIDALPFRLLSEFSTLQAAADWSANPGSDSGVVYLDENFRTDESNILLDGRFTLIGDRKTDNKKPYEYPAIISTNTGDNDPFFRYDGYNRHIDFSGVNFFNEGNARAFFVPANNAVGFFGGSSRWEDVAIRDFGATDAHPYTVHLRDGFGMQMDTIKVWNKDAPEAHGSYRFEVCNAASFRAVASVVTRAADATPNVYVEDCRGLHLDSLWLEKYGTDAALQITNSNVTVTNLYSEANDPPGAHCGIQIGDGGLTRGNTGGRGADRGKVTIIEPVNRNFQKSPAENIRYLNGQHLEIIGGAHQHASDADSLTNINYGGSNQHTAAELTVTPGSMHLSSHADYEIINNSGNPDASIIADLGAVYDSESAARNQMTIGETARINSPARSALAWRNGAGDVLVWWADDANRLMQLTTAASTDINTASPTPIPWDNQLHIYPAVSHSTSTNAAELTFQQDGRYEIETSVSVHAGATSRLTASIFLTLNGTELPGSRGYLYMRGSSGVRDASNSIDRVIDATAGDVLRVEGEGAGVNTDPITLNADESILQISPE